MNRHQPYDLKQMQSLPLEAKIRMTKARIKVWYESWMRFEIYNKQTGKTRFVTMDVRDQFAEPELKDNEFVKSTIDGQVYVSFSGGKDSTVLKHIVDSMYDDVPALFVNTGLEYPEIQRFAKDVKSGKWDCFNSNVEIIRPDMRFDEVIKKYGYPVISKEVAQSVFDACTQAKTNRIDVRATKLYDRKFNPDSDYCKKYPSFCQTKYAFLLDAPFSVSHKCCAVMKKNPSKQYEKTTGRKPFIGTLAEESRIRYTKWLQVGCNAFESIRPTSQPLSFWTEQDILHYIKKYNVPYASVYGDIQVTPTENTEKGQINMIDYLGCYEPEDTLETTGCDRTGCIFCMFGCHLEKEPNRFQRLKETHPRQYEYCIGGGEMVDGKWQPSKEGLGLGHVLDYIGVKYE
jgi:3'-phosphoadenosine 5'-phosphosulfate sulfotransferase (PAPS reductase)/FAD synthetase